MNRYALLIGCNKGLRLPTLQGAEADANRVRDLLLDHPAGWDAGRVTILTEEVTGKQIEHAVRQLLAKAGPEDFLFVYYAGHGRAHGSETHLALPKQDYPVRQLTDAVMVNSPVRGAFLVLDCCYSEGAAATAFVAFIQRLFPHSEHHNPVAPVSHGSSVARAVFAAASGPAWEDARGGRMTTAFIQGCRSGGHNLSATSSGIVDIDSLKRYIEHELRAGPEGQMFSGTTLGGFDIKTKLEWRMKRQGPPVYTPRNFVMLPEQTALWYASAQTPRALISVFWTGNPVTIAAGYRGQDVVLSQLNARARTFEELCTFPVRADVRGLKLSPDGKHLAVRPADDRPEGASNLLVFPIEGNPKPRVYSVCAGQHVVTSQNLVVTSDARDGTLEVWPTSRTEPVAYGVAHRPYPVRHMRAFGDGSRVMTGGEDGQVLVWDLGEVNERAHKKRELPFQRFECERQSILESGFGQVMRIAASPTGALVAAGFGGVGRVRVWSVDEPSHPRDGMRFEHGNYVTALEFAPDERWIASGCGGGRVMLAAVDGISEPLPVWESGTGGAEYISALAFAPESSEPTLAIGTSSGLVVLHEIRTAKQVTLLDPYRRGEVYRIALLARRDDPVQIIIAARGGIEGWNFSWDG